jgi:NAD(P)H-hydrate repair Nnr-like enzyme with NAD(P)H-hydrate epimerase domain
MRAAEQALIDRGETVGTLMERAGTGAAEWVWRLAARRPVTVLCGPGQQRRRRLRDRPRARPAAAPR